MYPGSPWMNQREARENKLVMMKTNLKLLGRMEAQDIPSLRIMSVGLLLNPCYLYYRRECCSCWRVEFSLYLLGSRIEHGCLNPDSSFPISWSQKVPNNRWMESLAYVLKTMLKNIAFPWSRSLYFHLLIYLAINLKLMMAVSVSLFLLLFQVFFCFIFEQGLT